MLIKSRVIAINIRQRKLDRRHLRQSPCRLRQSPCLLRRRHSELELANLVLTSTELFRIRMIWQSTESYKTEPLFPIGKRIIQRSTERRRLAGEAQGRALRVTKKNIPGNPNRTSLT
jgi:hypothetical protein